MLSRRSLLTATAAGAAVLPRRARAVAPRDRKFVFVFAPGGWDPTRAFADGFDIDGVAMESAAERGTAGGIAYIDHPDRPSVRGFFEAYHDRCLLLQGVMVRSIAHHMCTTIAMTGASSGENPDWPTIIGDSDAERFILPHLVLDGPSFCGSLGGSVARVGTSGQLDSLLSGEALLRVDGASGRLTRPAEDAVDRYLQRRAAAREAQAGPGRDSVLMRDFVRAQDRVRTLKDRGWEQDFRTDGSFSSQVEVGVGALAGGLSRCLMLASELPTAPWDSHSENDRAQSASFEDLFQNLLELWGRLLLAPGTSGGTLADETLMVVLSEMGRTPTLNTEAGKDHWPFTSMLLVGDGITGDRVVGGWDEYWYGTPVSLGAAEAADAVIGEAETPTAEVVGATLLALADIDPSDHLDAPPLTGIIA